MRRVAAAVIAVTFLAGVAGTAQAQTPAPAPKPAEKAVESAIVGSDRPKKG